MDEQYYARYAMVGWIFVAVLFAGSMEMGAYTRVWDAIRETPQEKAFLFDLVTPGATILAAILAGLIGVGAPPAMGFVLQHLSALIVWAAGGQMWSYPAVVNFKCEGDARER